MSRANQLKLATLLASTTPRFVERGVDVQTGERLFDLGQIETATVRLAVKLKPKARSGTPTTRAAKKRKRSQVR